MSIVDFSAIQLRGTRLDVSNFVFNGPMNQSFKEGSEVVMVNPVKPSFLFSSRRQLESLQHKNSKYFDFISS